MQEIIRMEKIGIDTKTRPGNNKSENGRPTPISIKRERKLSPEEISKLKEEWAEFTSKYKGRLEEISEEAMAIEKDYEYSSQELRKLNKTLDSISENIHLIARAARQSNLQDIQESSIKLLYDLKQASKLNHANLFSSLRYLITDNTDVMIEAMELNSPSSQYAKIFLLDILGSGYESSEEIIIALGNYMKNLADGKEIDPIDVKILSRLEDYYHPDFQKLKKHLLELLHHHFKNKPKDYELILACLNATTSLIKEAGWEKIIEMLKKYQFDRETIERIISKWQFGGGSDNFMPEAFAKNMEALQSIEKERPGIAKFLISKFGLYNFGRYPESLLIKQYDEYENQELPYGVVVFAEDDHNGFLFENKENLEEMAAGLEGKYLIRIMEANSKRYLLRLITRLRLKYGQDHKISFAVIGSHGNSSLITLGNVNEHGREIFIRDVIRYGGRKYQLFEDNANLALITCQTGEKGGIGNEISKAINVKTVAPVDHSGLESIKPILKKDGVGLRVKYSHNVKAATFKPREKEKRRSI